MAKMTDDAVSVHIQNGIANVLQNNQLSSWDLVVPKNLSDARKTFVKLVLNAKIESINFEEINAFNQLFENFINLGVQYLPRKLGESEELKEIRNHIRKRSDKFYSVYHQLYMLFVAPHLNEIKPRPRSFGGKFQKIYDTYLYKPPHFFEQKGEPETYLRYIEDVLKEFPSLIKKYGENFYLTSAINFLNTWLPSSVYSANSSLKTVLSMRARLVEKIIGSLNNSPGIDFEAQHDASSARIRLGVLSTDFLMRSETLATLPVFQYLDQSRFETILITARTFGATEFEDLCLQSASGVLMLSGNVIEDVRRVRDLKLDCLFFGTNLSSALGLAQQLAVHRMAPVQIAAGCCSSTTGIKNIDYFLSGQLTEPENAYQHYTENLVCPFEMAHCFHYQKFEPKEIVGTPLRNSLAITGDATIFVSGANFYKLVPELLKTWFEILAANQESVLLLYPFNTNWELNYPISSFIYSVRERAVKHNIKPNRIHFLETFDTIESLREALSQCDVYLDSFPYSGMTSILDPLLVNLPVVVKAGDFQRSRMSQAALASAGLSDWITYSDKEYVEIALRYARDVDYLSQASNRLKDSRWQLLPFFNVVKYSAAFGAFLEKACSDRRAQVKDL